MVAKPLDVSGKSQSTFPDTHRFIAQNPIGNDLEDLGSFPVPFQEAPYIFQN